MSSYLYLHLKYVLLSAQKRKCVDAAIQIIESEDVNALSLAKVAEISGLKRTSTYKLDTNSLTI